MDVLFEVFYDEGQFGIGRISDEVYLKIGPFMTFGDALDALPQAVDKEISEAATMGISLVMAGAALRDVPREDRECT